MTIKLLTFPEASALLNITSSHLRSLIFKKKIRFIKIGRLIRFDQADLINWISENKSEVN